MSHNESPWVMMSHYKSRWVTMSHTKTWKCERTLCPSVEDRWTNIMSVRGGLILKWIELSECFEQNIYLGTFQAPDRFHRLQCFRCHDGYMTQPVPQSRADWNAFPIFCHGFARYHNGSLKAGEDMDMMASKSIRRIWMMSPADYFKLIVELFY